MQKSGFCKIVGQKEEIYLSGEICSKTGIYKFINCDGQDYSILRNKESLNRNIFLLSPAYGCTFNTVEIFMKKGEEFPNCIGCGNLACWKFVKEK